MIYPKVIDISQRFMLVNNCFVFIQQRVRRQTLHIPLKEWHHSLKYHNKNQMIFFLMCMIIFCLFFKLDKKLTVLIEN